VINSLRHWLKRAIRNSEKSAILQRNLAKKFMIASCHNFYPDLDELSRRPPEPLSAFPNFSSNNEKLSLCDETLDRQSQAILATGHRK
jgi:hypothetical protein